VHCFQQLLALKEFEQVVASALATALDVGRTIIERSYHQDWNVWEFDYLFA
jgi:hypothetical protein